MIGQTVSHYKILEKLGEGGMGVVYKAQDLRLDRPVALKFLPSSRQVSADDVQRFQKEARALSSLNHPHIATIYDIGEAEGQRFIALEYLSGGTLKKRLGEAISGGREFPLQHVVEYGIQVVQALSHAHQRQIVHRDVKMENLMLTEDGNVKVTDFGLAKLRTEHEKTRTGSTLGTAAYMSPEQIRGEEIDHRSDIFSFGIVLYEITAGRHPFRGEHEAAITYSVVNESPPPISVIRPNVPPGLQRVISRCLEKDRQQRYQTCAEIVAELETVKQEISGFVATQQAGSRHGMTRFLIGVGASALALGIILTVYLTTTGSKRAEGKPSIAVLYLENLTQDPKLDAFTAGMTEEIINELTNLPDVQVVSRSDVAQFRAKPVDLKDVSDKLGVSYVLEGSVRGEGKQLRVTCQVIQAKDRFHLWSQGYTRELTNTIDVQTDIAHQVALGLKTKFAQKNIEEKLGLPAGSLIKQ